MHRKPCIFDSDGRVVYFSSVDGTSKTKAICACIDFFLSLTTNFIDLSPILFRGDFNCVCRSVRDVSALFEMVAR